MAPSTTRITVNSEGRRTNSLGFAKHDCHTCSAQRRPCDRQRPRCGPCLSNRQRCGGFATNLVWKDVEIPPSASDPVLSTGFGILSSNSTVRQNEPTKRNNRGFKFVKGRMKRKRKPKEPLSESNSLPIASECEELDLIGQNELPEIHPSAWLATPTTASNLSFSVEAGDELNLSDCMGQSFGSGPDVFYGTTSDSSWSDSPPSPNAMSPLPAMLSSITNAVDTFHPSMLGNSESFLGGPLATSFSPRPLGHSTSSVIDEDDQDITGERYHLTVGVLHQDTAHKYGPILEMYNEEFSMFPLTMDCPINPFRVRKIRAGESDFLLHAIVAMASQHLAKQTNRADLTLQVYDHRSTALRLFAQALCQSDPFTLLDGLLLIISLDLTQSALGTWGIHLDGARRLLEAANALKISQKSARIRAQIAFLVWWDVTLAFISREDLRLPLSYLDMLVEHGDSPDWSFFALNGCPIELVVAMAKLAKLASIYEKTQQMQWTIFDRTPVGQVITEVKDFVNREDATLTDVGLAEDDLDAKRDRFHCIEAWRHAILLYTYRVFDRPQDSKALRVINHLTRVTLDHVRCISRRSFIQKQVLLPVFLAGSEVSHEQDRAFIREYCKHWSAAARFYMFESTRFLLEDIWEDWDSSTRESYWWGLKVGLSNGYGGRDESSEMPLQVLLG